jgi:hypothetical protein
MENFNLDLFNLAINFTNGQKKVKLKSILKKMGVVILSEYWITKSNLMPEHVEFLTVDGYKISVQEIGSAFVASIEPMFSVGCIPVEDKIWRTIDSEDTLVVGDKILVNDNFLTVSYIYPNDKERTFDVKEVDEVLFFNDIDKILR